MSLKTYAVGRVYQIVNDVDDLKYVGSTGRTLAQRMSDHRCKSKKGTEGKKRRLYMHMRAIGVEHFEIVLIEQTGPTTKEALRAKEHVHIVAFDSVNNGLNGKYESTICEHQHARSTCKECGGSQICEHNRVRSACKDCGGASVCEHKRARSHCKDCGGTEICEHARQRAQCKDCGGSQICMHNRARSKCKDCGGSQICAHQRKLENCKNCNPCALCGTSNNAEHRKTSKHIRNVAAQAITEPNEVTPELPTV